MHPGIMPHRSGMRRCPYAAGVQDPVVDQRFVEVPDAEGPVRWRIDAGFLTSNWTCIWGRGCQGIHDTRTPERGEGCCSVGAHLGDDPEEAMTIAALADTLDPAHFEFAAVASADGIFADSTRSATRVVDGACIFLNRPGFAGGAGCALHLAAVEAGEDPLDWKPGVCWRLPLRLVDGTDADGTPTTTVRAWRRDDWGEGGRSMAWWCTDTPDAFAGDEPVVASLEGPLRRILGDATYDRVRERLSER